MIRLWAFLLATAVAAAQGRHALVIGNDAYQDVPKLANAVTDSRTVASALRVSGFQVTAIENTSRETLESTVDDWIDGISPGAAALVYYAGHGVEINGANYLLPVDVRARDSVQVRSRSLSAQELLDRIGARGAALQILVLDACRNNPFPADRSIGGRGLAPMMAASGAFIAFSTSPRDVAPDNSQYAQELAAAIKAPGLKIEEVFKRVSAQIQQATNKRQVPWVASSIAGEFYFANPPVDAANVSSPVRPQEEDLREMLEKIEQQRSSIQAELDKTPSADYQSKTRAFAQLEPKIREAIALCTRILSQTQSADVYRTRAELYDRISDDASAARDLEKIVKLDPGSEEGWQSLWDKYDWMDRPDLVIKSTSEFLATAPSLSVDLDFIKDALGIQSGAEAKTKQWKAAALSVYRYQLIDEDDNINGLSSPGEAGLLFRILDPSGAAVAGAKLTLVGTSEEFHTNNSGLAVIPLKLAHAPAQLKIEEAGFRTRLTALETRTPLKLVYEVVLQVGQ